LKADLMASQNAQEVRLEAAQKAALKADLMAASNLTSCAETKSLFISFKKSTKDIFKTSPPELEQ